jgi:glycosyltransferase involved in cell wall biosynthesis
MIESTNLISIVIPAYNCEDTLEKCLDSLKNLRWKNTEIIIINDGSTDGTSDILKKYKEITVINTQNKGPSNARNLGIKKAKGEFIAFTDSDCIVDPGWLDELFKGFTGKNIAGVGGDQQSPYDESDLGKSIQDFMKTVGFVADYLKTSENLIKTNHNPTCNVLYRKSILLEIGGFDEKLWPGEDVEIDLKIIRKGYLLYYNPKAIVYHYRPKSLKSFSRMMDRYGWAQAYLVRRYGPFRLIHYEAPVLFGFILLFIVICFKNIAVASFIIAAGIIFTSAAFSVKTKNLKKGIRFAGLFYILMVNWNLGFLKGMLQYKGGTRKSE